MAKAAEAVKENTTEKQEDSKKQAQSVELSEAGESSVSGPGGSIGILLDMNVPVTVTIGQTEIPVKRLLQLGPGAVLKLNKPINEPIDLYLSDSKFATGTVVVVDGRFAVKITQILGIDDSSDKTEQE
jgi:flagellar motor switch protein FliN/FliY